MAQPRSQSWSVPGPWGPLPSVPAVHGGFQLCAALRLRLESGSEEEEEEDGDLSAALEPGQAGGSLEQVGAIGVLVGAELRSQGAVMLARPCWRGWRRWRPTSASSAPSWALRSCCGAAGSWSCCGSSRGCASGCRSGCCGGAAVTAPSCWGMRRSPMPVGARERAPRRPMAGATLAAGTSPSQAPGTSGSVMGHEGGSRVAGEGKEQHIPPCPARSSFCCHTCPRTCLPSLSASQALPGPAHSELQQEAAWRQRRVSGSHGATPGLAVAEPNGEHHPDPLQLVGSLHRQGGRAEPAPRHRAQAGGGGATQGLQNTGAAPFTSSLAGSGPSVSGSMHVL
ncbi:uncharacterized protein LOC134164703 [Pezoporus occidentalis]|uniref:uncharacterized protein LOC134164703 n=1 Tax=Pezoporus occidentalis TaxID=407982 RepID=UPI002F90BF6E